MPFHSDKQRKAVMAHLTEQQLTTLFAKHKISPYEYQQGLIRVASSRHKKDIAKCKYRASMSASKWN